MIRVALGAVFLSAAAATLLAFLEPVANYATGRAPYAVGLAATGDPVAGRLVKVACVLGAGAVPNAYLDVLYAATIEGVPLADLTGFLAEVEACTPPMAGDGQAEQTVMGMAMISDRWDIVDLLGRKGVRPDALTCDWANRQSLSPAATLLVAAFCQHAAPATRHADGLRAGRAIGRCWPVSTVTVMLDGVRAWS